MAVYYFEIKNYSKSLALLQNVEFTDVFYHLGSKSMLLKMYYERADEDALFSLMSAFKIYLKRNRKISERNYMIYKNLILFTNKVFKLKMATTYKRKSSFSKALLQLKSQIENNTDIVNVFWLNEKIRELE